MWENNSRLSVLVLVSIQENLGNGKKKKKMEMLFCSADLLKLLVPDQFLNDNNERQSDPESGGSPTATSSFLFPSQYLLKIKNSITLLYESSGKAHALPAVIGSVWAEMSVTLNGSRPGSETKSRLESFSAEKFNVFRTFRTRLMWSSRTSADVVPSQHTA